MHAGSTLTLPGLGDRAKPQGSLQSFLALPSHQGSPDSKPDLLPCRARRTSRRTPIWTTPASTALPCAPSALQPWARRTRGGARRRGVGLLGGRGLFHDGVCVQRMGEGYPRVPASPNLVLSQPSLSTVCSREEDIIRKPGLLNAKPRQSGKWRRT